MSELLAPTSAPLGRRRFMWIAVAVVAVVLVGCSAGLVAAALSSHSPASSAESPTGAPQPLKQPPGGIGVPGIGSRIGGALGAPVEVGTVSAVSATGFTLTPRQGGTITVAVTSSTRFVGFAGAGLASLKSGAAVAVFGTLSGGSHVDATLVSNSSARQGLGGSAPSGRGVFGSISSIGTNEFVVTSFAGAKETVKVSASTVFSDVAGGVSGLSSLKKGESVVVRGTVSGSVVDAVRVLVVPAGRGPAFGGGSRPGGGFGGGPGGSGL